jgi:hypothetical protein
MIATTKPGVCAIVNTVLPSFLPAIELPSTSPAVPWGAFSECGISCHTLTPDGIWELPMMFSQLGHGLYASGGRGLGGEPRCRPPQVSTVKSAAATKNLIGARCGWLSQT